MDRSDQLTATVHALPDVDLGPDLEAYEDTTLDAGAGFESYLWSTSEESQKITVESDGAYSVKVTDQYGCSNSDTVNVTILSVGIENNEYLQELSIYPN